MPHNLQDDLRLERIEMQQQQRIREQQQMMRLQDMMLNRQRLEIRCLRELADHLEKLYEKSRS